MPDAARPVAAIIAADSTVGWVVWPDAPMPDGAIGAARLWPTSTGAWLVYTADDDDDPELCRQSSAVFITAQGVGAACDLGVGHLVGADDGGLWVGAWSASRPVLEDDDEESWEADLERQRHAVDTWTDRLELNGVDGIEWPLAPVTEEARSLAITRIRARFEGLGDPYLLWTSDDHVVRRSPSDYRAVEVVESGEWPGTEIIVSFEHRRVHDLRLRRRYRVFDDAGRPRTWAYATVHLEEDIATGAVPPRSAAVDGVLEV